MLAVSIHLIIGKIGNNMNTLERLGLASAWLNSIPPNERWGGNNAYRNTYVSKKKKNARKAQRKARKRNR